MDIREKIKKIQIDYHAKGGDGAECYVGGVGAILELFCQEIESAIPKERDVNGYDEMANFRSGYNQALSDIRTELQRKGLI